MGLQKAFSEIDIRSGNRDRFEEQTLSERIRLLKHVLFDHFLKDLESKQASYQFVVEKLDHLFGAREVPDNLDRLVKDSDGVSLVGKTW